jgi:APA family basic amino acid/polyamine antiporter
VPQPRPSRALLAVLGTGFGLAVTIGNTIGAGILRTPGVIAAHLTSVAAFLGVWVAGALYALLGANALAELGTMVPRSGGQYVFVRRALGDYAGFIVGWSDWLSTCGTTAAVSIVVGEYATAVFPILGSWRSVALVVIAVFTLVQWFGVRAGGDAQNVTSVLKALAFVALIVVCFWLGGRNPFADSLRPDSEEPLLLAFILSLQSVIYTYDGWSAVIYFSEEVREPARDIPRSMFGGIASVAAIYLLVNVAFLRVLPLGSIGGSTLAAASVAQHLFGRTGATIIRAFTAVALLSAVSSNVMMAPRVLFAMSRDRLFWRGAAEVNKGGTPDVALLFSSALAAAFIVSGTFEQVIAVLAFFFVVNYMLSFLSLFQLRWREPEMPRPFRAKGHPWTTGLALLASVAFLIGAIVSDKQTSVYALVVLALSFPAYWIGVRTSRPHV